MVTIEPSPEAVGEPLVEDGEQIEKDDSGVGYGDKAAGAEDHGGDEIVEVAHGASIGTGGGKKSRERE